MFLTKTNPVGLLSKQFWKSCKLSSFVAFWFCFVSIDHNLGENMFHSKCILAMQISCMGT